MKQYVIKIFLIIPIVLLMVTSCSNYLELEPEGDLIQQEFWKTKEQVSSAVAGCYASMNQEGFMEKVLLWGELRGEMMVSSGASTNAQNMLKNYILPSNGLVNWSSFYQTINYCNLVLELADGAQEQDLSFTEQELKRYKAEVLTIRSLCYFILVKNFKEVPLVLTATSNTAVDFYPAKNTEAEIITQITADLTASVNDLSVGFAQSTAHDKGRMTKGAAYALLADIYLWDEQYNNCIDACNSLVALGKYDLVQKDDWFNQLFFEGNSVEGIFELQHDDIFTTLRNAFYYSGADYAPFASIQELYNQFPSDIRGEGATFYGPLVYKYAGVDDRGTLRGSSQFYNNWIFYRYADVLLMQAEAYLLSPDRKDISAAYNLIDRVHQRATALPLDVPLDENSLLDALLVERQKEFAFEGKRWYDLLRYARRNNFAQKEAFIDLIIENVSPSQRLIMASKLKNPDGWYLPIYESELDNNPNLTQNSFYITPGL